MVTTNYYIFVSRNFPPTERVMRTVTMTKCLYAMIVQQKFTPEKRAGWNLVETSNPQYKAQITGIKIVSFLNTFYFYLNNTRTFDFCHITINTILNYVDFIK